MHKYQNKLFYQIQGTKEKPKKDYTTPGSQFSAQGEIKKVIVHNEPNNNQHKHCTLWKIQSWTIHGEDRRKQTRHKVNNMVDGRSRNL